MARSACPLRTAPMRSAASSAQVADVASRLPLNAFSMNSRTRVDRATLRRLASLASAACSFGGSLTEMASTG